MRRDMKECEKLWRFCNIVNPKGQQRLHFACDIQKVPTTKKCVVVVDESDDIMLKDPIRYYQATKYSKQRVICLTATPDDGYSAGSERTLVQMLGYSVYYGNNKASNGLPIVHERTAMSTLEDIMHIAEYQKSARGVLIYATELLYDQLSLHPLV
jgi:hypothetical protein